LSNSSKVGSSNGSIGASTTYFSKTSYRIFVTGMRHHFRPAIAARPGCPRPNRELSPIASRPEGRRDNRRNEGQSAACGEHAPVMIHVPVMVHREPAFSGIYVLTRPIDRCPSGMLLHSTTRRRDKNRLGHPDSCKKKGPRYRRPGFGSKGQISKPNKPDILGRRTSVCSVRPYVQCRVTLSGPSRLGALPRPESRTGAGSHFQDIIDGGRPRSSADIPVVLKEIWRWRERWGDGSIN
jgi:hypothetical protein